MNCRSFFRVAACACAIALWLQLSGSDSAASTTYAAVSTTPYDRQMLPTLPILRTPATARIADTSFATINRWMLEFRMIPYEYSVDWKTSAQLASAVVMDCKGKSAMLYARMRGIGVKQVYFVIGKRRAADLTTHAWLEWRTDRGTYVLDPTFRETALRVGALDGTTYIPQYAYDGVRKYRMRRSGAVHAPAVVTR